MRDLAVPGFERVVLGSDPACGYRGIVAIHSTALGQAVGGTRVWRYPRLKDALADALRLARGMTYKNAAAGLPLGGGKSVILQQPGSRNRDDVLLAHARLVDALGGRYVAAEDVGTTPADMRVMRGVTEHVAGLDDGSGDPSPWTARGVLRAMQACVRFRHGSDELAGRTVALQGCGNVGGVLAREVHRLGATLVVSDLDDVRARRVAEETGARVVPPAEIHAVDAHIFAPCALGGVLNARTIPQLRAGIVVGAANNQLATEDDGERLHARGVVYAPDFIANAGGVINGCRELAGWDAERSRRAIDAIGERVLQLLEDAAARGVPTAAAADRLVEERLRLNAGRPSTVPANSRVLRPPTSSGSSSRSG